MFWEGGGGGGGAGACGTHVGLNSLGVAGLQCMSSSSKASIGILKQIKSHVRQFRACKSGTCGPWMSARSVWHGMLANRFGVSGFSRSPGDVEALHAVCEISFGFWV